MSWQDTSEQRVARYYEKLGMVALINDQEREIPNEFREAFLAYHIELVGFSNKELVKKSLPFMG